MPPAAAADGRHTAAGCRTTAAREPGDRADDGRRDQGRPGLLVRALWFVFIGWWLTGIVLVGRLVRDDHDHRPAAGHLARQPRPTVLTLRPRTSYVYA